MKLIQIDKARYRKHLNYVIVSCIVALVVGSLGIAQALIALFPDASGSHFHWNLTGVVVSAIGIGFILNKYRRHPFMTEVTYVWELKQVLNKINRKLTKIKNEAQKGDVKAMQILHYSYAGSRLLWRLDDNSIVMDELSLAQNELDVLADKYHVPLSAEVFDVAELNNY
ncbi:DUF3087 domain-containing protein [Ningiella sp. W23]|uniref:DUF3087 domain-containing protein n=1 Tax=Ningiella sp. W23 TaxID=3023715 RepID=UPI0037578ED2